jgi:endogenous inhibitor of DNA gyrase (YacG/DUF329 family)
MLVQMPDLRCPLCGTPVLNTGISSAYATLPPDAGPNPELDRALFRQRSNCPSCGKPLVRNVEPGPEALQLAEWRLDERRPLAHFGGTAIMRSTDVEPGTPRVVEHRGGSVHVSSGGSVGTTGVASGATDRQVWIRRTEWEAAMTGIGMGMGSPFGSKGVVIGGAAGFVWSRFRWSDGDEG